MRYLVAALLLLHGSIHLFGLFAVWRPSAVPGLTGDTLFRLPPAADKPVGVLWLVACLLLWLACGLLLAGMKSWWLPACAGLVLSQLLIVYAWPDARWGTLANVVLLVPVLFGHGHARFAKGNQRAIAALLGESTRAVEAPITSADLAHLPAPVQHWLTTAKLLGTRRVRTVRLRQHGWLRGSANGAMMPVRATQYVRTDPPGFVWCADVEMMHVLPVSGRDSYLSGHGKMTISLAGLLPVVQASNDKIDEASLQRYLAELVWYPAAALDERISWRALGEGAEATLRDGETVARVQLDFDAQGRFRQLNALRYKESDRSSPRERWQVTASAHRELAGVLVPSEGEVRWLLASGDLTVYRWVIDSLEYDGAW